MTSGTVVEHDAARRDAASLGARASAPEGKRIAYVQLSSRSESSCDIGRGVQSAAEFFGYELEIYDPDFDPARRASASPALSRRGRISSWRTWWIPRRWAS